MATYPSAEIGRKMKRDRQKAETSSSKAAAAAGAGKGKIWEEEQQQQPPDAGMDELLAVLGYKVRASDMAEVAQKLEQLEVVMGTKIEDGLSHLSTDVVHYNPSDLSGWVQTMLYELNNTPTPTNFDDVSNLRTSIGDDFSTTINFSSANRICDDDLRAIPGGAIFGNNNIHDDSKEKKKDLEVEAGIKRRKSGFDSAEASESAKAVVLLDSQETGIRLVHTLMACAEAVQQENLKLADALVKHIGLLAVSQAGAMRKVATYFAEALARRIYKIYPLDSLQLQTSYSDVLEMHFYETCPYLKFAHFTANQAILEAFGTANRVHVIDFSLKQGMQWPALMQALALRSGGPPAFRLTGIGPQQPENTDTLHQVVWRLARFADTIGVEFEFSGFFVNSLADQDATMPEIPSNDLEFVAVNSVLELHGLLSRPGAIEKVLDSIKAMKPKIVTLVEQEANHNGTVFLDRFNEALHYYSTMFDSLESSARLTQPNSQDLVMSEVYLGRQICNVVACEGVHRVERHETLSQWRGRFKAAGFDPVHLGSSAFKQASMLLALFAGGDGYRVEENEGCLMLGWHTRPLIATSAWQLGGAAQSQGVNSVVGESWFVNN